MNCPAPRRTGLLTVSGISLFLTPTAHAHMAGEGAGQIVNGALHPLMTPSHVLILLGLGLLLGTQVPLDLKTPLRVFAPVTAIALALTASGRVTGVYQPLLIGIAMGIAILVGLAWKLPLVGRMVLCAVAALGVGLDSGVESGTAFQIAKTLVGTWLCVNVAVVYIAICASNGADKKWAMTAIRIIGSWIVAISLMVLAFSLRK